MQRTGNALVSQGEYSQSEGMAAYFLKLEEVLNRVNKSMTDLLRDFSIEMFGTKDWIKQIADGMTQLNQSIEASISMFKDMRVTISDISDNVYSNGDR